MDALTDNEADPPAVHRRSRTRRAAMALLFVLAVYLVAAYLVLPALWRHYEHQKGLATLPMVTRTAQGIPGDPMNVGLIGDRKDVVCAMHAAGWYPADPITLKSTIEIVGSVLLDRPYRDAPVSSLFYLDRRPDLVFEKPVGSSADRRNHVRFWKVLDSGEEKRPVWLGAATLDRSVGISSYTGAVTHHIAPDLDAERALLATDLESSGMVTAKYQVTGIGATLAGHNGGGDPYFTDGEIWVLRLVEACRKNDGAVEQLPSPAATEFKDQVWHAVVEAIGK
ncbi:LssY C-terminal domain-containing protein [Bradyrhizobium genosp. L]|uniref:LssY C-terminal domain-containing protein n=1 Tax=Bradyrhizobium genosp. L TaxID=83637 RepID=UPI0018A2CDDC|nr:LssY C-terminal domain-containing protein [Bradyrhizobium genosp. L]QPF85202.1 LssY C-terminal domain-containing protein [Bradyrhizobium genosp. L]